MSSGSKIMHELHTAKNWVMLGGVAAYMRKTGLLLVSVYLALVRFVHNCAIICSTWSSKVFFIHIFCLENFEFCSQVLILFQVKPSCDSYHALLWTANTACSLRVICKVKHIVLTARDSNIAFHCCHGKNQSPKTSVFSCDNTFFLIIFWVLDEFDSKSQWTFSTH